MNDNVAFGQFLRLKRTHNNYSLRQFAELLEISPVYLCDIEKGRKPAPKKEILYDIINRLNLTEEELYYILDLAAVSKKRVPYDLQDYIMNDENIRIFLRKAQEVGCSSKEWKFFISYLTNKYS